MPLGFAPFYWFFLPPVLLAILFLIWIKSDRKQAAWAGFAFALGMNAVGVSRVFVSLNTYGEMPLPIAVFCVVGFIALLSVFPLASGWLQGLYHEKSSSKRLLLVMPIAWTVFEYARNHVLTGFSWLELGYSQTDSWVSGSASIFGVHGVTLVTAMLAGCLAAVMLSLPKRPILWRTPLILAFGLLVASLLVKNQDFGEPSGKSFKAAMIQMNVPLSSKWSIAQARQLMDEYLERSRNAARLDSPDVIIWPEAALPLFVDQLDLYFHRQVATLGVPLLAGFLERRSVDGEVNYFNSAILFQSQPEIYRKQHLVPFGEYTPFLWLFGALADYFEIPMSDMSPWIDDQENMRVAGRTVGLGICYEDAFPYDVRKALPEAELLMNLSEDAWFGNSFGPHQRLQMARMRTLETERPMLRVSNTGLSAAIDHKGNVLQLSPQFTDQIVLGSVQPRAGATPYVRFGDWPLLVLMGLGLLAAHGGRRRL